MDTQLITRARARYLAGDLPDVEAITCACGAPRPEHSGASQSGRCAATGCNRYRPDAVTLIAVRAAQGAQATFRDDLREYSRRSRANLKKKAPGTISVRPSDVGECRRAVYYRETPPEDYTPAPSNMGAAFMGGIIHDEFMRRRAVLYPWRLYGDKRGREVYLPGMDRPSKYDEYDPITGRLVSIKTAGSWRWEKVGQDGADDKWWDQDHLYAMCLIELGYPVDEIEVLVIDRADGKSESFTMPYDPERALRVLRDLHALATGLDIGIVPPRDRNGPSTDGICRNCPARRHCWNMEQAEALGKSPENLTILGPDPDDEYVEQLAGLLIATRREKTDAELREKELKALLDGVELRPYGEFEPVPGHSANKEWKAWADQVDELWHLPESMRPAELPEVRVNRTGYVTWKLLRKATRLAMAKARKEATEVEARERQLELDRAGGTPLTVVSERVTDLPLALEASSAAS